MSKKACVGIFLSNSIRGARKKKNNLISTIYCEGEEREGGWAVDGGGGLDMA